MFTLHSREIKKSKTFIQAALGVYSRIEDLA